LGMAAGAAWLRGELAEAERLGRAGLTAGDSSTVDTATAGSAATEDDPRWWAEAALANTALSQGRYADAVGHALAAGRLSARPTEHDGIAALAAAYEGDLDRAEVLNARLAAVASSPTLRALHAYVAGEIDNAAGQYGPAEEHYRRAITLSRVAGASFIDGIASVGLVTVQAAAGRITEALQGYRRLLGYWERTGSWLQQWTTLRNLAGLLHRLGDHEAALLLAVAADHAPDAPAVSGPVWPDPPPGASSLPAATVAAIRAEATTATSRQILAVARRSIDTHLDGLGSP
jgi:tetratricopeptide (TPR) repeat protein